MFSYLTKTVGKAYKASKKLIKQKTKPKSQFKETQIYKQINSLCKMKVDVLPISKMNDIAAKSFDYEDFELICVVIVEKLQSHMNSDTSQYRYIRNLLLLSGYLIKHGAGGFIDQFRDSLGLFENYGTFSPPDIDTSCHKQMSRREDIRNRADYVITLLNDKQKLLRQKQLAMLVKQKMKIHGNENKQQNQFGSNKHEENSVEKQERINGFIENYIWKYIGKIDQKLDDLAEKLADQVEKLLIGDIPDSFQIDELEAEEIEERRQKTEKDLAMKIEEKENSYLKKKNMEIIVDNLLD